MLGGNREPVERPEVEPGRSEDAPGAPEVSATFLPLDDERILIGSGDVRRSKKRPTPKKKPPKPAKVKPPRESRAEGEARTADARPSRFSIRLGRPSSARSLRIALVAAAVVVPAAAFALVGGMGGEDVTVVADDPPTVAAVAPVIETIDIENLVAVDVSAKRVVLEWDTPDAYEEFRYTIYRGTEVIGETGEPRFVDTTVEPSTYYYYAVTAIGSLGTPAASLQLLVPVPSKNGEMPAVPTPPPPPLPPVYTAYVPPPTMSPSPSKSPSPSPSKTPSPSPTPSPTTVSGGGGPLPTGTTTSSTSPAPTCQEDPTQPGCGGGTSSSSSSPPPPPPDPCLDPTAPGCTSP